MRLQSDGGTAEWWWRVVCVSAVSAGRCRRSVQASTWPDEDHHPDEGHIWASAETQTCRDAYFSRETELPMVTEVLATAGNLVA